MDDAEQLLLATVADLYYNEKFSQDEIAEKLFFSRSKVSRMLQRAHDVGVVEIHIKFPYVCLDDLEERICRRYNLKNCSVLRTVFSQIPSEDSFDRLTRFAARYIEKLIKPGLKIGISSGKTVSAVSKHIKGQAGMNLKFVQVKGMASADGCYDYDSPAAIQVLAKKFESSFSQLFAPLFVKNELVRKYLLNEPLIANVLSEAKKTDFVIASVASIHAKDNIWSDFLTAEEIKELKNQGALGSMMGHFFNHEGQIVNRSIDAETISLSLEEIKALKHLLLVAAGEEKAKALDAVLKTSCVSTLIIDEILAQALLRLR